MIFATRAYLFSVLFLFSFAANEAVNAQTSNNLEVQKILEHGISLEQDWKWVDAIQHYEQSVRSFPENHQLRRRLLISRLHYDVHRRVNDSAINKMMEKASEQEALQLYSEVLARMEASYVDAIDLHEILRGGTAYLEVALTEPKFLEKHVTGKSQEEIEAFRTSIHRVTLSGKVRNRFDARHLVANAAKEAHQSLGIRPTTTVVQFILGAVGLLDPYSSFLSSSELSEVESQIEGSFVGLGIALQPHEVPLKILNVIKGGPARDAGLESGDKIVEIGTIRCQDVGAERAADLLRGPKNSHVRLLIAKRDGSTQDLVVVRRRVEVPSIEDIRMLNSDVGYFKISSFQKTTAQELDQALWSLHRSGFKSLIIDLRGNPGGWLDASIAVADRFLPSGRIVSTRGKNGIENQNYSATRKDTWDVPLTLLIDQESASASEILAGAIRDNNRGELIGVTTYGKGSVQGLYRMKNLATGVRLTVSKFYSPNGKAISEQGVDPTHPVEKPVYFAGTANQAAKRRAQSDGDQVLQVALERAVARLANPHASSLQRSASIFQAGR